MKARKNGNLSPSKLVMDIMKDLRDTNGVSLSEIIHCASVKHGMKEEACKVPLELALKRGVKYNIVNVKKGLKKPIYVFNLPKTGRDGKKLKYMESYVGRKSKGCLRRPPQKKTKMTKTVSSGIKGKGAGGMKASRCKWCKKLIQNKRRQVESTRTKRKAQRRPMKES